MGLGAGGFVALMMIRHGTSPQTASILLSEAEELVSS